MNSILHSNDLLSMSSDRIDLWLLFTEDEKVTHLPLAALCTLLTTDEVEKARRFHFTRDRTRHILTRVLVRSVLSRYVQMAPEDWRFSPDKFGRPVIQNTLPQGPHTTFNISHTDNLIALAVASKRSLGIDVEICQRRVDLDIVDHFFSQSEVASLRELPAANRQRRFLELWTLKESYIKARGMGLSLPLNQFGFVLSKSTGIQFQCDDAFDALRKQWLFWQMAAGPDHLLALCTSKSMERPPSITVRRVVPGLSEDYFDCTILRTSHTDMGLDV